MRSSTRTPLVLVMLVASGLISGEAVAHGSFHGRLESLDRRLRESPSDPELWLARAALFRTHGDWALALEAADRAAALEPRCPDLHLQRGSIWLESGDPARAEAELARFVEMEPRHAGARIERARALMQLSRPLEAAREYEAALELQAVPTPEVHLGRARALARAGDTHLAEAIEGLDRGLAALGPVAALESEALELEVRAGRFEAALARSDRLAAGSPRPETWLVRRASILERMHRTDEARASYRDARDAIDRLPEARRHTDAMQQLASRVGESLARLERAEAQP